MSKVYYCIQVTIVLNETCCMYYDTKRCGAPHNIITCVINIIKKNKVLKKYIRFLHKMSE